MFMAASSASTWANETKKERPVGMKQRTRNDIRTLLYFAVIVAVGLLYALGTISKLCHK